MDAAAPASRRFKIPEVVRGKEARFLERLRRFLSRITESDSH
jgi:hypothetical protein